jgi:8-oxo-dGTP diphosphatase
MVDIHKAGGIIIRDRKLLLTRSKGKDFYVAPGGKLENNETPKQALARELTEEVMITVNESDLVEFGSFRAIAAGSDDKTLIMDVYTVNKWDGMINPSSEIEEIRWVTSKTDGIQIGSIFEHEIIPRLSSAGLID